MVTTIDEFPEKWIDYLNKGHYRFDILNILVIQYRDKQFGKVN